MATSEKQLSVTRLRVGVLLFVLWWIPVYLAVPSIAAYLGVADDADARHRIFIAIILVQSAVGAIGFLLIGKTVAELLKKASYKKLPGLVWHLFWSGHLPEPDSSKKAK